MGQQFLRPVWGLFLLSVVLPVSLAEGFMVTDADGAVTNAVANISIQDALVVKPKTGSTQLLAAVTLKDPWPAPIRVDYRSSDGSANSPVDYLFTNGSVTFPSGVTTQFISVSINGNTNSTPKYFQLSLVGASETVGYTRGQATCWILPVGHDPQISLRQLSGAEDNYVHDFFFELSLSAPSPYSIWGNYTTADRTALAGVDYLPMARSFFIPSGTMTQFVRVPVLGNLKKQSDRIFLLNLSALLSASQVTTQLLATIRDDDLLTLPTGYSATQVAQGFRMPSAFEIAPDGRIFVCEQEGAIRVIKDGQKLAAPLVTVSTDTQDRGEAGLTGIALDPGFTTNQYFYVYYTVPAPHIHNRVSRFTLNGDVAIPGSEVILLELDELDSAIIHNGGGMQFGPDRKLYIGVGDNGKSANAQSLTNLLGKVLRINPDGSIPQDNPFFQTVQGRNRAIWALGLRNPFSLSIQPGTGRIFINDVGESSWEEINEGTPGGNYGWPLFEGAAGNPGYLTPFFTYPNKSATRGDCAITAGTFYNPANNRLATDDLGKYFFSDYCGGWIKWISPTGATNTFASGIGNPVGLKVGPDGALYCLGRGRVPDSAGQEGFIFRFEFNTNGSPRILFLTKDSPNQCKARVSTVPGRTYVLQVSSDLQNWKGIVTNVSLGVLTDFVDSTAGATGTRFYRILQ